MGYTTTFKGILQFDPELTAKQLAAINKILGEDCRDHPEWNADGLYCIDLELTDDFSGIEWDGMEKTYQMEALVNVVIEEMRKQWPDFGLKGKLAAQGEDIEDRWELLIVDGLAVRRDIVIAGKRIICPCCDEEFIIEQDT